MRLSTQSLIVLGFYCLERGVINQGFHLVFLIENNELVDLECLDEKVKNILIKTIQESLGYNVFKPIKEVKVGGKYRHYDGEEFIVENISQHTDHDEKLVNYQKIGEEEIWSRPIETFTDGRFQLID